MKIPYLSTTFIKNYPICGMRTVKAHETRVEEGDGEWGSNPTRFGTIIHEVAEEMHKMDMQNLAPDPMDIYDQIWRRSNLFDFRYYDFGREAIAEFIDRTLFNRRGVTIAVELGFILDLVDMSIHNTEGMDKKEVLKICKRIVKRGGIPVISKIDRIDQISATEFEVYDYKTNMQPFTRDEVENSEQLAIYHMALQALYPEAEEIICIFDMLRHGRFRNIFTDEKIQTIRHYLINLWHQVEAAEHPVPELNQYCGWCEFREHCPVYAEALAGDLTHPYAPGEDATTAELFKIMTDLKVVAKIADQRAQEFSEAIMARIMDNSDGKPVPLDDEKEIYLMQNPRYDYPIDQVFSVLSKRKALTLLKRCASISKPKLEAEIHSMLDLRSEIEPLLQKGFAKPTIKARKKGKVSEE